MVKQGWIFSFHELKATIEVGSNPAVHVIKPVGEHPTLFMGPAVYLPGTVIFELLNDHE